LMQKGDEKPVDNGDEKPGVGEKLANEEKE
jgi:hypothetical protein